VVPVVATVSELFAAGPQGGDNFVGFKGFDHIAADFAITIIQESIGFGLGATRLPRIPEDEQIGANSASLRRIDRLNDALGCARRSWDQKIDRVIIAAPARELDAGAVADLTLVEKFADILPEEGRNARLRHHEHVIDGKHGLNERVQPLTHVPWRGLDEELVSLEMNAVSPQHRLHDCLPLRGDQFQPARAEIRKDIAVVGENDLAVPLDRIDLKVVVVPVEEGSSQLTRAIQALHRQAPAQPIDVSVNELLAFLSGHTRPA
jgi:hypothetical protein